MWILADILIVAIIAFFVYTSVKKGFVKSIMGSAARIVTIVLVFNFNAPFGAYLGESAIGDAVRVRIEERVENAIEKSDTDDSGAVVKNLDIPEFMSVWVNKQSENSQGVIDNVKDNVKDTVFSVIMRVIASVILYIIIRILFHILICILGMIVKLPVIGSIDKSLGIVAGVINAVLVIGLVTAVIMFFTPITAVSGIENTFIFKYVYYILLTFLA